MVPSVRTTSRRHDDARVLRQDDDEDDEKRNAGNDHGCLPLTEWLEYRFCSDAKRLASIMVIFYHMKRLLVIFDEIVIFGLSTRKIVASP
jgi:hypothetical protein